MSEMKDVRYSPSTQWGVFTLKDGMKADYIVGHAHEVCPKCGSTDTLSFGVPTEKNAAGFYTKAVCPFHWCACGHKWTVEVD